MKTKKLTPLARKHASQPISLKDVLEEEHASPKSFARTTNISTYLLAGVKREKHIKEQSEKIRVDFIVRMFSDGKSTLERHEVGFEELMKSRKNGFFITDCPFIRELIEKLVEYYESDSLDKSSRAKYMGMVHEVLLTFEQKALQKKKASDIMNISPNLVEILKICQSVIKIDIYKRNEPESSTRSKEETQQIEDELDFLGDDENIFVDIKRESSSSMSRTNTRSTTPLSDDDSAGEEDEGDEIVLEPAKMVLRWKKGQWLRNLISVKCTAINIIEKVIENKQYALVIPRVVRSAHVVENIMTWISSRVKLYVDMSEDYDARHDDIERKLISRSGMHVISQGDKHVCDVWLGRNVMTLKMMMNLVKKIMLNKTLCLGNLMRVNSSFARLSKMKRNRHQSMPSPPNMKFGAKREKRNFDAEEEDVEEETEDVELIESMLESDEDMFQNLKSYATFLMDERVSSGGVDPIEMAARSSRRKSSSTNQDQQEGSSSKDNHRSQANRRKTNMVVSRIIQTRMYDVFFNVIVDCQSISVVYCAIELLWIVLDHLESEDRRVEKMDGCDLFGESIRSTFGDGGYVRKVFQRIVGLCSVSNGCEGKRLLLSKKERDLRNDLYIVALYLTPLWEQFLPDDDEEEEEEEDECELKLNEGLCKFIIAHFLHEQTQTHHRLKEHSEDFEFFKLSCDVLIRLTLYMPVEKCFRFILNAIDSFCIISGLLNYIDLSKQVHSFIIKWTDSQIVELWGKILQVVYILSTKVPRGFKENLTEIMGLLLSFYNAENPLINPKLKKLCLCIVQNLVEVDCLQAGILSYCEDKEQKEQHPDLFKTLIQSILKPRWTINHKHLLRDYSLSILTSLMKLENSSNTLLPRSHLNSYIARVLNLLNSFNQRSNTVLHTDDFVFYVVSLLWNSVPGHKRNEEVFVANNGVESLLDCLEVAVDWVQYVILGCLSDLCLCNNQAMDSLRRWKSSKKTVMQVLIEIFQKRSEVVNENFQYRFGIENNLIDFKEKVFNLCMLLNKKDESNSIDQKRALVKILHYDKVLENRMWNQLEKEIEDEGIRPTSEDRVFLKAKKNEQNKIEESIRTQQEKIRLEQEQKDYEEELKLFRTMTERKSIMKSSTSMRSLIKKRRTKKGSDELILHRKGK